ncbi:DNA recombination protein RmuC [Rhizobium sp. 32-5/1]|uniref:DNA recombination protein RmuC n=1 Tax=Rhizobium sp. 32-5/1 TaxID=3019602 RepID=UPI00240E7FA7|nr:DNA recombination protein RmuC [Rhizobium sp. 32-5/1]WEZ84738.1 DNA recombination protein RmuC [Rhizobium sp. 32-5/1]
MEPITLSLDRTLFVFGDYALTLGGFLLAVALLLLASVCIFAIGRRNSRQRAKEADARMMALITAQTEMQGRIAALADVFGARQSELNQSINQRIDGMTQRIGTSITEQTKATHENLRRLQERLAVIDTAQTNIQSLAKDMAGLQNILSNKQTRGAFGQSRMETIIADGLPMGAYAFQPTLSNGSRPDCTIRMPNDQPVLVIDAKFPLEGWNAIRAATDPEASKLASQQFRRDMEVHIRDISGKYLIAGETQDTAFLFVPSESIFAEIHEHFEGIVQRAHRARIVIVSPSLLMLSIQVIQAILRDARMREQAHLIQGEVVRLMEDLTRLDERVRKLHGHFLTTQKDVDDILVSSDKLKRRGSRIEALDLATATAAEPSREPKPFDSRLGQLKLRVVDED